MKRFPCILLALSACSSSSPKEPEQTRTTQEFRMEVDPKTAEPIRTNEWGTDRTHSSSKTMDWVDFGTTEGSTYVGGNVIVDRIIREDGQDMYGVRIRLGNRSSQVLKLEYRVLFYDRNGIRILGQDDRYHPAIVESRGVEEISEAARLHGAVGFQLLVRAQGSSEEGKSNSSTAPKQ